MKCKKCNGEMEEMTAEEIQEQFKLSDRGLQDYLECQNAFKCNECGYIFVID